jgi:GcrA cell cycle regulator
MWNDDRETILLKMWVEGWSASVIANRLGGVTRNAVIGKLHRLGKKGRTTIQRSQGAHGSAKRAAAHKAKRKINLPKVRELSLEPPVRRVPGLQYTNIVTTEPIVDGPSLTPRTVETLTLSCCRWPIGDPQSAAFHFCGGKAVPGLPYCQGHALRAYNAPVARTRPSWAKGRATVFDKGTNVRVYA